MSRYIETDGEYFEKTLHCLKKIEQNNISELSEISKLKCLPMLRALVLLENPVCLENGYRIEVLILLRKLERLDKDHINEDERQEAEEIYEQRCQEEAQTASAEVIELEEDDE